MDIRNIIGQWALDQDFLHGRMSFICGPRQIGKTTLVRQYLERIGQRDNYHNWDSLTLRQRFASNPLFFIANISKPLVSGNLPSTQNREWIVFDEIHKYPHWKDILKGYYDEWKEFIEFIITGSARLDYFRRSGDSLVGRYFLFKMNPLHPNDLTGVTLDRDTAWTPNILEDPFHEPNQSFSEATDHLYHLSGFPEPASVGTKEFYQRWKNNHISLITTEDVRDLSRIENIQKLQTLVFLLPERVGSPLSVNNLKNILGCAHASVQNWLEILKKVYLVFDLLPYSAHLARSVRKERKFFFWDWGLLEDEGKRFENFVAVQLKRAVSAWTEWGKGDFNLSFVRTKDGREVDFVITSNQKACLLIECKMSERTLSPNLRYFKDRLQVPMAFQVIETPGHLEQVDKGIFVMGLDRLLKILP